MRLGRRAFLLLVSVSSRAVTQEVELEIKMQKKNKNPGLLVLRDRGRGESCVQCWLSHALKAACGSDAHNRAQCCTTVSSNTISHNSWRNLCSHRPCKAA